MSSPTPAAPANGSPGAPRLIGPYRVMTEKGGGTFGTVYFAEDSRTGQPVAIRVLPREVTDTPTVTDTIRRRAQTVIEASQAHPSLVRVLEYGNTEDGHIFAVMERAEGRLLSDVLAELRRTDVATALQRAIEIGGPIETLHNVGLVHAAVRPNNFVVAGDDSIKLLDAELTALRDLPAVQHLMAERSLSAYLAPEQIGRQAVSEKTDVYAFGVLLYELLAGAPLFEAESREEIFLKHLRETPPLLNQRRRGVPVVVEITVAEALDKVPGRRPFMQEVLNQIATDKTAGPDRWKRFLAPAAGLAVAASIVLLIAWSMLAPRLAPQVEAPPAPAVKSPAPPTAATPWPVPPAAQVETPSRAPAATLELPPPAPPVRAAVATSDVQRPPQVVAPATPPPSASAPSPPTAPRTPSSPTGDGVVPFRPVTPSTPPGQTVAPTTPPRPVARPVTPSVSAAAPATAPRPVATPATPPSASVAPVAPPPPAVATPVVGETTPARAQIEREPTTPDQSPASLAVPPAASIPARESEEADPRALIDWLLNKRSGQ
jgi:serine/threonine protein kinase